MTSLARSHSNIKVNNFISTGIEWIPLNYIEISYIDKKNYFDFFESLEDDDDVQNVYSNAKIQENN